MFWFCFFFFFFKQKTAYEMRISDWSSDVCSSDLASFLVPMLDAAAGVHDLVRAHRRVADEHDFIVRRVFVQYIEHGNALAVAACVVLPHRFVDDRKSVVYGKRVSVSVDTGGRRIIKKKNETHK